MIRRFQGQVNDYFTNAQVGENIPLGIYRQTAI